MEFELTQRLPPTLQDSALDQRLPVSTVKLSSASDWYSGTSELAGKGVFAARDFPVDDVIGVAMHAGGKDDFGSKIWNLTELARYCNHQHNNNVVVRKADGSFLLVASKPIQQDDELVSNYVQVTRAIGPRAVMQWEGKDVPTSDLQDYTELESDTNEGS